MAFGLSLIALVFTVAVYFINADISLPPSIYQGPPKIYYFLKGENFPLICEADGYPEPTYEWRLNNGPPLECGQQSVNCDPTFKIIGIKGATSLDEGSYQCIAYNDHGKTMSNILIAKLQTAESGSQSVTHSTPSTNEGFSISCNPPASVPSLQDRLNNVKLTSPVIQWNTADNALDNTPTPLPPSNTMQIDMITGDLYFATPSTTQTTAFYKCGLGTALGNQYSGFTNVSIVGVAANFPAQLMFKGLTPQIGLETEDVDFQCFFSGRPTPSMNTASWGKVGGNLPLGRYNITQFGTRMRLSGLRQSDAGSYSCQPQGGVAAPEIIPLAVEAVPRFDALEDRPHNINVTDQDTIVVNCKAYAIPPATVAWYLNGAPLIPGGKFQLNSDHTELTISDLCKVCEDLSSDLMSLQCNASNVHGYSFVQGYINVLLPTVILTTPINRPVSPDLFKLDCSATTDESTNLEINWDHNGAPVVHDEIHTLFENGTLTIDLRNITGDMLASYCGSYTCTATNGVSSTTILSNLTCGNIVIVTAGSEWWISLIVIGLFLLLLILLLLIFFCCIRDNGDTYPVDEKERENGNNPEQEIREKDFKDYQRNIYQLGNGNGWSAASTLQHPNRNSGFSQDFTDYDNGVVNPVVLMPQGNGTVVYRDPSVINGMVNYSYERDEEDPRVSFQPYPAPPYETYPGQIELLENGARFGNSDGTTNLMRLGSSVGNGSQRATPNRMPLTDAYPAPGYNYGGYDVPVRGDMNYIVGNDSVDLIGDNRAMSVEI